MKSLRRANKLFAVITSVLMLVQPILPAFQSLPPQVFAQEVAPTETQTPEPTSTEQPTPTQQPTEPSPTDAISPTPTAEQTPTGDVTPSVTPEVSPTVVPTETSTPSPTDQTTTPQATSTEPPKETGPPKEDGQILEGVSTSATPTVTPAHVEEGELQAIVLQNIEADSLDLDNIDPSNSATLTTDKADYAPTDTAIITGTDFTPGETYNLTISSQDPPATSTTVQVTADENGTFVYAYQLDGIYRPNYIVEAKELDGDTVDEVTFTDSHIAGYTCVTDAQGADDQPGQKDLTQMCYDYSGLPTTVATEWNWDDTSWPGANTGDACSLFDKNNNGFADSATCVTVEDGPPATQKSTSPRVFTCNDTRSDRCAGAVLIAGPYSTNCSVSQQSTNPFNSLDDTVANCTTYLSEVGGSAAQLLDVCSFPSVNPNSDPSDCIRAAPSTGKLEVIKDLSPTTDTGLFNLQIDGTSTTINVGDNGTTGEQIVSKGDHTVGETAGTATSLSNYTSGIVCKDLNGTGSTVASSSTSGPLTVNILDNADVVCVITNSRINNASLTIIKDAVPNDAQNFSFTATGSGLSNFSLDDDSDPTLSNTKSFTNLAAGIYSVSEASVSGWTQTSAVCSDGSTVDAINLSNGENVTCTFTNTQQKGHLIVQKTTVPSGSQQSFAISATGSGTITGGGAGTITDAADHDYEVTAGTYSVTETVPTGWTQTSNTCTDVAVAAGGT